MEEKFKDILKIVEYMEENYRLYVNGEKKAKDCIKRNLEYAKTIKTVAERNIDS